MDLLMFRARSVNGTGGSGQLSTGVSTVGCITLAHVALGDGAGYGLLWWVREQGQLRHFSAVGYGGQLLLVVPAQQLVVVAQHEWWQISSETAVKNITAFYNEVFMKVVEGTRESHA
jgi:CubicO group peptidase (beta-lactamase class C family)